MNRSHQIPRPPFAEKRVPTLCQILWLAAAFLGSPAFGLENFHVFWGNNRYISENGKLITDTAMGPGNDFAANGNAAYAVNQSTRQLSVVDNEGSLVTRITASANEYPRAIAANKEWLVYVVDGGDFGNGRKRVAAMPLDENGRPDTSDIHVILTDDTGPKSITAVAISKGTPQVQFYNGEFYTCYVIFWLVVENPFDTPSNRGYTVEKTLFGRLRDNESAPWITFWQGTVTSFGNTYISDIAATQDYFCVTRYQEPDVLTYHFGNKIDESGYNSWLVNATRIWQVDKIDSTATSFFLDDTLGSIGVIGPSFYEMDPLSSEITYRRSPIGSAFGVATYGTTAPQIIIKKPSKKYVINRNVASITFRGVIKDDNLPVRVFGISRQAKKIKTRVIYPTVKRNGAWRARIKFPRRKAKSLKTATFTFAAEDRDGNRTVVKRRHRFR